MQSEMIELLKPNRGYKHGRSRPYPFEQTQWIAETYIPGRTAKRTWKVLREERSDKYLLFATPERAAEALEEWVNRFEDE